ncbi:hypothetical protein MMC25_000590 [Agyrium rufum]|nr:hypothetical protein [Agyrium rufum]
MAAVTDNAVQYSPPAFSDPYYRPEHYPFHPVPGMAMNMDMGTEIRSPFDFFIADTSPSIAPASAIPPNTTRTIKGAACGRKRVYSPKVRTGCITCKIRRVKCDEQKPECLRCRDTGRKCDGYLSAAELGKKSSAPNGARKGSVIQTGTDGQRSQSTSLIVSDPSIFDDSASSEDVALVMRETHQVPDVFSLKSLSTDLPGTEQEKRSFYYYHTRATRDLAGYFESEFWERQVLQASHREPAIRHALLALSSIYETFEERRMLEDPMAQTPPVDINEVISDHQPLSPFAVSQYNKAVKHLIHDIRSKDSRSRSVTLIACLLFVWIELIQGGYAKAISHLRSGLQILNHPDAPNVGASHGISSFMSFPSFRGRLLTSFSGLVVQAAIPAVMSTYPDLMRQRHSGVGGPIASVADARTTLDTYMNLAFLFMRRAHGSPIDAATARMGQMKHRVALEEWYLNFRNFLSANRPTLSPKDLRGTLLLQMHYTMMIVLLKTCLAGTEVIYDEFDPDFARIVGLADTLLDPVKRTGLGIEPLPCNSFETGVIAPLYYTAIKCRLSSVRRKAIALLWLSPRKEGIWERVMAGKLARRVVGIEEEGAMVDPVTGKMVLTEERRISRIDVIVNYDDRELTTMVWRGAAGRVGMENSAMASGADSMVGMTGAETYLDTF